MESIDTMHFTSLKEQLDPITYKRCKHKFVEIWYSLTQQIFFDYMYRVSSSNFPIMFFIFSTLHYTLYLYVLINFEFVFIVQQELAEASDIALNHYNEIHPIERTFEGVLKAMSTAMNNKHAMLSSGFTKWPAIADINLTHALLEEVKHWGSFLVPEMLLEKLHCVAVSNVDTEVKVGWLKLWNDNRFDKDALYFPKSPVSDSALDDWLSKSTYWAQLEKNVLRSLIILFNLHFNCHRMYILSQNIPKLGSLRFSIQYSTMNSKTGRSRKIMLGMSNLILILL